MKRPNPHRLEAFILLLIAAAFACVICIEYAKAQHQPPTPSSHFNPPFQRTAPHVAVTIGDTTAYTPNGTRYTLPSGSFIEFDHAEMDLRHRVTYLHGHQTIFSGGFE